MLRTRTQSDTSGSSGLLLNTDHSPSLMGVLAEALEPLAENKVQVGSWEPTADLMSPTADPVFNSPVFPTEEPQVQGRVIGRWTRNRARSAGNRGEADPDCPPDFSKLEKPSSRSRSASAGSDVEASRGRSRTGSDPSRWRTNSDASASLHFSTGPVITSRSRSNTAPTRESFATPEELPQITKRGATVTYFGDSAVRPSVGSEIVAPVGENRTTNGGCVVRVIQTSKEKETAWNMKKKRALARAASPESRPAAYGYGVPSANSAAKRYERMEQRKRANTTQPGPLSAFSDKTYSSGMENRRERIASRAGFSRTRAATQPEKKGWTDEKFVDVLTSGCKVTYRGVNAKPSLFPTELARQVYGNNGGKFICG